MKYVNVVSSWPVKNPLPIAQSLMQELKTHAIIVIRTSKCTARIKYWFARKEDILTLISSCSWNSTIVWHRKAGTAD